MEAARPDDWGNVFHATYIGLKHQLLYILRVLPSRPDAAIMGTQTATRAAISGNLLLNSLSPAEFGQLRPFTKELKLKAGDVFADYCDPLRHIFFPTTGLVCLISTTENGQSCEMGYIGFEGMVGLPVIIGRNEMPHAVLVHVATDGYRADVTAVKKIFSQSRAFHDEVLRFAYVLLKQTSQTALCNRFHSVEQRLARWLSIMAARSGDKHLRMTQEMLAQMLGAQRTTVVAIASTLQARKVISYRRGKIDILDPGRLRKAACECLAAVATEYRNLVNPREKSPCVE